VSTVCQAHGHPRRCQNLGQRCKVKQRRARKGAADGQNLGLPGYEFDTRTTYSGGNKDGVSNKTLQRSVAQRLIDV
jgi:hypothetical protein